MALTGLQIYKVLPKTNCRDCGFPTCLAFAMRLAAKQTELAACPHISEEAKVALGAASVPPIRLVTIGSDERKVSVGNETELFRHDKTFYHEPGIVVRLKDSQPLEEVERLVEEVAGYRVEYVGMEEALDGFAIENTSGNSEAFASIVEAVCARSKLPLILMAEDPEVMRAGLSKVTGTMPLIYVATGDNWSAMADLAAEYGYPLAVRDSAGDLSALTDIVEKVKGKGLEDLVLDPGVRGVVETLTSMTQIRRLALRNNFRPLGFPIISFPGEGADSPEEEIFLAAEHIAKYSGLIVLDQFDPASVYPLLVLRRNIYTDPQKPIQMTPGIYDINGPTADSPVLVTTNFSITYFSVANEVDGSGIPAWLLIADTEGLSVLTAWAAGKFDALTIAKAVNTFQLADRINHRKIAIPGAVAVISGELEEELPGWDVRVGPREAMDIPSYLRVWE